MSCIFEIFNKNSDTAVTKVWSEFILKDLKNVYLYQGTMAVSLKLNSVNFLHWFCLISVNNDGFKF